MSKRLIVIFLLTLLASACTSQVTIFTPPSEEVQNTQPVVLNPVESVPIATATPLILAVTEQPLPTIDFPCSGAPAPHVKVGQQVTVMAENSDKLKLRSDLKISPDTVMRELDQFTQLSIAQGPFCVHSDETGTSYWFWQVKVIPSGEFGWVADGDSLNCFLEVSTPVVTVNTPTMSTCPGALTTRVVIGQQVTVVTENTDKLKLREIPVISPDTEVMDLDKFTKLNILDGPVCAYSNESSIYYWFWKVEVLPGGEIGWVAEGDFFRYFIE